MKRKYIELVATAFVLAALIGSAWAQDAKEQLKKLEIDRAAAAVKGDTATLDKQTADDYVFISMNGRMADKSQMLDGFKSAQTKLTSNDLSDLKVRVYGDAAVVTGKADVKGTLGGQDATGQILFTRVYVKKGGHWQSVSFQQTRISNP